MSTLVGGAFRSVKGTVMLGISVLVLVAAYGPVFSFWLRKWLEPDSYYSHAPFVPVAAVVLVVMARRRIALLPVEPATIGLLIMAGAALLGWIGRMGATLSVMGMMLPVYLFGAVVALFGWQTARALRFPIFFLLFMCVMPETIVDFLSFRSQMVSTALSGILLKSAGLDATVRGAEVVLPHISIQVGTPCSGFRLLISLLAIASFLVYVRNTPVRRRNLTIALAIPLGLAINGIRIGAIAAVGEFYGRSAVDAVHNWTGWMVLLIAAAVLLRASKPPKPEHADFAPTLTLIQVEEPRKTYFESNAALVMVLTLVWSAAIFFVRPATVLGRPAESFNSIPVRIGMWKGTDLDAGDTMVAVPSSSVLLRDYRDSSGSRISLAVVYGYDLADLHKPEYCLEGSGWRIERKETVTIVGHKARLLMLSMRGTPNLLCLYWFAGSDGSTDEFTHRKFDVLRSAMTGRKPEPTALVRLTAPVRSGGEVTTMRAFGEKLDSYVIDLVAGECYAGR